MAFRRQQNTLWRIAAWGLLVLFVAALGHHALPLADHGCGSGDPYNPLVVHHGDEECGLCVLLGCLTLFAGLFIFHCWSRRAVLPARFVQDASRSSIGLEPWLPRAPPLMLP